MYLQIQSQAPPEEIPDRFADALDAMVRLLKAGMPVTEADCHGRTREFDRSGRRGNVLSCTTSSASG
jgi:hypothetical protein